LKLTGKVSLEFDHSSSSFL